MKSSQQSAAGLAPEQIDAFFELQRQELEVRNNELEVRRVEIDANVKMAEKSIETELQSQTLQQTHSLEVHGNRKSIIILVIICITAFSTAALFLDKDAVVLEIIKIGIAFLGGGGVGFAYANKRTAQDTTSD